MNFNNLSKLFRYVNDNGDSIVFDYDGGYLINKPAGIDTLTVSLSQAKGINQTGATIQSKNVQPRAVTITGRIVGESQDVKKEQLLSVIRPDIGGKLFADDLYLTVSATSTPTIGAEPFFARFQFSVLAPYPYWCKDDSVATVLSGIQPLFKFPWNLSRPYQFGKLMETKFINVYNKGQVPVPYTATFTAKGDVKNPKISNATTGKFLMIQKTLVSGERLVVEITHDRTYVTSSIDGDCRGALSLSSNLYELDVGDNVLKPEAESGLKNMQVNIDYSMEIVGITL